MDQSASEGKGEVLDPVHEGVDRNLSLLAEGVATDAVGGGSLSDRANISEEVGTSEERGKDLGSDKEVKEEEPEGVEGEDKLDQQKTSDTMSAVDQGTSYSSNNMVSHEVLETVVVIEPVQAECANGDHMKLEVKVNESGLSKVSVKATKGVSETDKNSCVIDIKGNSHKRFSESSEGERICRICHLASGRPSDATAVGTANGAVSTDLVQLGCACKDELGIAHIHCSEAWFKLKGNRICEICGQTAKNVSGVADTGFMEEWNEGRFMDGDNSSRRFGGCWRGQPFCNFLMACLVIAFVLPWFFRVNMF